MTSTIGALVDVLSSTCEDAGVVLYDVEMRDHALVIEVERDGGLDLDGLAEISTLLSEALDQHEDLIALDRYELEVSTPGVERRLRTPEHFAKAIGSEVAIRLIAGPDRERRVEGRLIAADDVGVTVEADGASRRVAYDAIERARLIFDWKAALAERRAEEATAKRARPAGAVGGASPRDATTRRERA